MHAYGIHKITHLHLHIQMGKLWKTKKHDDHTIKYKYNNINLFQHEKQLRIYRKQLIGNVLIFFEFEIKIANVCTLHVCVCVCV